MLEFIDPEKFDSKFRKDLDKLRTDNLQANKLVINPETSKDEQFLNSL
jgi:hypothetical protein